MLRRTTWVLAALLFFTHGCFFVAADEDPPLPVTGTLVVDWSIDGLKDPEQCDQGGVDVVHIAVITPSGSLLADYEQDCTDFAAGIELSPGEYAADVVLLDFSGFERTTPVRLRPFSIYGHDQLEIPVDFPASSFY